MNRTPAAWPATLEARTTGWAAFLLACALAVSGWMHARHMEATFTASVAARQAVIAERVAAEVAGKIEARRGELERFARDTPAGALDDARGMAARLRVLGQYHPDFDEFWVAGAGGRVVADYPQAAGRRGSSVADREYFRRARQSGQSGLAEPEVGRFSGQGRVIVSVPVAGPGGEFAGAIAGVVTLQSARVLGELTRQKVGQTGHVGVITAGGVVLAHPQADQVMEAIEAGRSAAVDRIRAGFEGTFEARDPDGIATLYATRRIAGTDWFTYAARPVAEAYAGMLGERRRLARLTAVLALAGGLAAWLVMSWLLAPLARLEREIRRIADDPRKARPIAPAPARRDEIGSLAGSFNDLLSSRLRAEAERSAAFEQGRRNGEIFEALHRRAPIGMALLAGDGGFRRTNPAFQKITGYTEAELAQMREPDLTAPGFEAADRAACAALARDGAVAPYEKSYLARGGVAVPVRVSAVLAGEDAATGAVWWLVEDITARRQMLDALRASEAEARMLSAAASHTGNMVVITDAAGRIEWVNGAFEGITGYRLAQVKGRTPGSVLQGPGTDAKSVAAMRVAVKARQPFSVEVVNYARDGRRYWAEIDCTPVFDHLGRLERFVSVARDVTATRELRTALEASEEKHRRIFEAAREVIWESDGGGALTSLNPAWERLSGYPVGESLGRPLAEFVADDQGTTGRRALAAIAGGAVEELDELVRLQTRAGERRWVEIRARAYRRADGGRFCVGSLHDVHERRLAEASRGAALEALRDSQERYARAVEGSSDAIWEGDLKTGGFFVSERFTDMLRLSPAARPTTLQAILEAVHPDDLPAHRQHVESMVAGSGTVTWEARFRTGDGAYHWLRVRGRAIRDAAGVPVITAGTASDIHASRLAGDELRRHRDTLAALVEQRTAGLEAASREAGRQRVQAERARDEAEAARLQAVSANLAKSEFLANMSHELRTPMHAIISFAGFGMEKAGRADAALLLRYFTNIRTSGTRLLVLLNDLLDLSKLEAGRMSLDVRRADLAQLIGEAIAEVEALARARSIDIVPGLSAGAFAPVDAARMLQVLRNLLANAIKFTPEGGTVRICCRAEPQSAAAGFAILVSDTGVGIPEHELETVFVKFFQSSKTKTGAGGTGLGLAICREIVAAHGGTIEASNNPRPGAGATFRVWLPAAEAARPAAALSLID